MDVVGDAVGVRELVELLVVDAMGALDLAIEMRGARANVHVSDVEAFQVPMKLRLEFGAVVRLHGQDAKREPMADFVDEET